jgi:protein pelota
VRVLHRDLKAGEVKLLVQTEDDLWHLYNLLEEGDLVYALTYRREEVKDDKLRAERGEKKRMRLGISLEKVEFQEFSDWLRVHGVIESGPQDVGSHHTLNISVGDDLSVVKQWRNEHLERIREAEKAAERPLITFLAIDEDEAVLAQLREYGVREVATVRSQGSGKQYASKKGGKDEFYIEVLDKMESITGEGECMVIGPGFEKENICAFARQKNRKIVERCHVLATGQSGMAGVQEILKKGIGTEVLLESRVAFETQQIEQLLTEISKDGLYAYGETEVEECSDAGAIDTLLITDKDMRKRRFEKLLSKAEGMGSRIVVISSLHDAGKKLDSLGGIGALLRYKK